MGLDVVLPDGARLWARVDGDGPAVVLLHGGPGLWDYLGSLADLLADDLRVVRFDQRACGRSTGEGPFTLRQAVDDLDALRAALGIERWYVVGHSWGAELAVRYAAAYAERTISVVYLGGVGAGDAFVEPFRAEHERRLGEDLVRWRHLSGVRRTLEEEREWCLLQWRPDFSPAGHPDAHAAALWETRPPGIEGNQRANRELTAEGRRTDLLEDARRVRCPVTMVLGADDPRSWTFTESLLEALPDATRHVLPDAGHAPWVEQPDVVRRLLLGAIA